MKKNELEARNEVKWETYTKKIQIEARVMGDLRDVYKRQQHHLRVHGYVIPLVGMVRFQCR